jgi:hypothetical protein
MRKKIKENGEYLIVPEKKKLLYERLYNNIMVKSGYRSDEENTKESC